MHGTQIGINRWHISNCNAFLFTFSNFFYFCQKLFVFMRGFVELFLFWTEFARALTFRAHSKSSKQNKNKTKILVSLWNEFCEFCHESCHYFVIIEWFDASIDIDSKGETELNASGWGKTDFILKNALKIDNSKYWTNEVDLNSGLWAPFPHNYLWVVLKRIPACKMEAFNAQLCN